MAVLFLNRGNLGWIRTDAGERLQPIPSGATHVLRFDATVATNRNRLNDIQQHTAHYTLTGPSAAPVLSRDGSPVADFPVASPPRSRHRDMRALEAIRAKVFATPPIPLLPEERAVLDRMLFRLLLVDMEDDT